MVTKMVTNKEREDAFRKEFQKLLDKHGAEITITDDGKPYGFHSGVCLVSMDSAWDAVTGDCVKEFTEFSL